MSDKKIFCRGEVYINPDDHLMMVTEVSLMDSGLYRIDYVTEEGAQGWFDTDEKAIMNNIELYDQPTPPVSESEAIMKDFEEVINTPANQENAWAYCKFMTENKDQLRQALQRDSVDLEALKEELTDVIFNTHDIDVKDEHYAQNIIDHLLKHHKGKVIG